MPKVAGPQDVLVALEELEQQAENSSAQSRREYDRFAVRGDAVLANMDSIGGESVTIQVMLRDVSRGGIGFLCQQKVDAGTLWRVSFMQHGYAIAHQGLQIRHCRELRSGVFLVGGQFVVETGLMCILGVPPAKLRTDKPTLAVKEDDAQFLPPGEVG